MASISLDEVKHITKLSGLNLNQEKQGKFQEQLSGIISYIGELKKVDTEGVEPTSQTTGLTDVFRKDEINSSKLLTSEEAISQTNNSHNNYFLVEAIFENKDL